MKYPIDAAGNRVNLSEFEVDVNSHWGYDDVLNAVQDDAYQVAVQYCDVDGTEPNSDERWRIWDTDAHRVRDEFESYYKDEILRIIESR